MSVTVVNTDNRTVTYAAAESFEMQQDGSLIVVGAAKKLAIHAPYAWESVSVSTPPEHGSTKCDCDRPNGSKRRVFSEG